MRYWVYRIIRLCVVLLVSCSTAQPPDILSQVSGVWTEGTANSMVYLNFTGHQKTFAMAATPGIIYPADIAAIDQENHILTINVSFPGSSGEGYNVRPYVFRQVPTGQEGQFRLVMTAPTGRQATLSFVRRLSRSEMAAEPTQFAVATGETQLQPAAPVPGTPSPAAPTPAGPSPSPAPALPPAAPPATAAKQAAIPGAAAPQDRPATPQKEPAPGRTPTTPSPPQHLAQHAPPTTPTKGEPGSATAQARETAAAQARAQAAAQARAQAAAQARAQAAAQARAQAAAQARATAAAQARAKAAAQARAKAAAQARATAAAQARAKAAAQARAQAKAAPATSTATPGSCSQGNWSVRHGCAARAFQASDSTLNARYRQVIAGLPAGRRNALAKEELQWIIRKRARCQALANRASGGEVARRTAQLQCWTAMTRQRTQELGRYARPR